MTTKEDTSRIDAPSAFLDLLFAHCAAHDTTLLMISQDPGLARRFDRVMQMDEIATIRRGAEGQGEKDQGRAMTGLDHQFPPARAQ
ncbi:MAG: hypothetical protein CSA70_06340 [Rhodobacterales bacterium]|nr:MAG: hypothetical protein CSA70_06340 [Rhodobacterales bacterium]